MKLPKWPKNLSFFLNRFNKLQYWSYRICSSSNGRCWWCLHRHLRLLRYLRHLWPHWHSPGWSVGPVRTVRTDVAHVAGRKRVRRFWVVNRPQDVGAEHDQSQFEERRHLASAQHRHCCRRISHYLKTLLIIKIFIQLFFCILFIFLFHLNI